MLRLVVALLMGALVSPVTLLAAEESDLGFAGTPITLSTSTFYVGDTVRVYARVKNYGDVDAVGAVYFYQGTQQIGARQPVSLPVGGSTEEVFVDYVIPENGFNIRAVIADTEPYDSNRENDTTVTTRYETIADEDQDGVLDEDDNCPDDENGSQRDTDGDGKGDVCDADDDNDRLPDEQEDDVGTDPLDPDTDDDGVDDNRDTLPLSVASPVVTPPVTSTMVETAASSTTTSQTSVPTTSAPVKTVSTQKEEDVTDEDEDAYARPTVAYGVLRTSPLAQFTYVQDDWNTFTFQVQNPQEGYRYTWDFGDGAVSTDQTVTRDYAASGSYDVVLASEDVDGNTAVDTQQIAVPFFSMANPWIQAAIAFLALVAGTLCVLLVSMKRKAARQQDDV